MSDLEKHSQEHSSSPELPQAITENDPELSGTQSNLSRDEVHRIFTTGSNNEYIHIGRQKFLKNELYEAFGGTLNPGWAPPSLHKFANPAPLGLSGFALTTFVLSMINAKAMGIEIPNVVVAPAMFYGGLVQLIAGIWEIALENAFGGTALCSFGGFWLSFGSIYIPWFGIREAYEGKETELGNALGFYLLGWCIFTFGLSVCTMKSTVMFFALFFLLAVTFLLLSIGAFTGRESVNTAGGVFGVIVSFIAWYNAFAGLTNKQNSYIIAHSIPLPSNERHL